IRPRNRPCRAPASRRIFSTLAHLRGAAGWVCEWRLFDGGAWRISRRLIAESVIWRFGQRLVVVLASLDGAAATDVKFLVGSRASPLLPVVARLFDREAP